MQRQCTGHAADGLVVFEVDRPRVRRALLPAVPSTHQRVLQDGKLIHVVADVVQQALHQARRHLRAAHTDRAGDGALHLIASQARNQILTIVDRFRQVAKACAIAKKVRAHGDEHINRNRSLLRRRQQQLDECRRLVARTLLLGEISEAEDFFELVHHHQNILVRLESGETHRVHQSEATAPQCGVDHATRRAPLKTEALECAGVDQGVGKIADGIVLRAHKRDAPVRTGGGKKSPF